LFLVIGNKYGSVEENAVGMGEVAEFEKMWNLPVVRVRNQTNSLNPASLPEVILGNTCELILGRPGRPLVRISFICVALLLVVRRAWT
jgi:hypothetical protein